MLPPAVGDADGVSGLSPFCDFLTPDAPAGAVRPPLKRIERGGRANEIAGDYQIKISGRTSIHAYVKPYKCRTEFRRGGARRQKKQLEFRVKLVPRPDHPHTCSSSTHRCCHQKRPAASHGSSYFLLKASVGLRRMTRFGWMRKLPRKDLLLPFEYP